MIVTATKVNQRTGATWNRRLVMNLLRRQGPLSRRQLSQLTKLQGSTLTYIVRELLDRGVLTTAGKRREQQLGKQQLLVTINPDLGWVLGVDLRRRTAQLAVTDACGTVLDRWLLAGESAIPGDPQSIGLQLRESVQTWLASRDAPAGKLLGVGVGVPGVVDPQAGVVLKSTALNLTDFPLRRQLEDRLECPVQVDHNANLAALAESRQGAAIGLDDFVHLLMNPSPEDDGVRFQSFGTALYLRGEPYRGCHFAAGELDRGFAPESEQRAGAEDLAILADEHAPLSPFLVNLAENVGRCLGHLLNLLDPQAILLGGDQPLANIGFRDAVRMEVDQRLIPIRGRKPDVRLASFAQFGVTTGAAMAALDHALLHDSLQPLN
ncbi:MAG: ROK family transcriptional regulator [Phycisphaeraceae bacterium]|nr:ROK family transcriptional regulator [Phycisphaeraceae bacterium]